MTQPADLPSVTAHVDRRRFLHVASATVFTAGVAPAIVGADDKAGTRPVIVGEGDFQFECHHNWGELPDTITYHNTHGVTVDKDGLVYVTHRGNDQQPCDTVVVFDPDGKYVRSFGQEYAGGGHGIDIREEDGTEYLYLSDTFNRQAVKCDTQGEWLWKKRYPREAGVYQNIEQFKPTNISFHPDGGFYVGDGYGSSFLHQYDKDANWVRTWGGKGDHPGEMSTPHGQWLDDRPGREPSLVVADRANSRLQYFSLEGNPLSVMQGVNEAEHPNPTSEQLAARMQEYGDFPVEAAMAISFPADVDIQGDLMLVPDLHARILIFDGRNQLVANLSYDPAWTQQVFADKFAMRKDPSQWQAGRFVHPHDACFDQAGNIYVAEWVETGRVTFLRRV